MVTSTAFSTARRRAASSLLLVGAISWAGSALWVARTFHHAVLWTSWQFAVAATLAVASVGIARRSVLPQVLARGVVAWIAVYAVVSPWEGPTMGALRLFIAALAVAALLPAAPGLGTPSARAEFAPTAYRSVFLLGAIAAVTVGISSAFNAAWESVAALVGHSSGAGAVWGPALLAVTCLASAVGVVRMRAWGVLLGAGTAVSAVACALPVFHQASLLGLAYVCAPGVLLAAPLVASRLANDRDPRLRVASPEVARLRVAAEDSKESVFVEASDPNVARSQASRAGVN
jgi:hypothetical protein